jgi:hypothetical protein
MEDYHPPVLNNNAYTLFNGTPVYASGEENGYVTVDSAKANSPFTSLSTIGFVTADILPDSIGLVTVRGYINDVPYVPGPQGRAIYLPALGGVTQTKPISPNGIVLLGTVVDSGVLGTIDVAINQFARPLANKSYGFTSRGITSGTYYRGGFYKSPLTAANLTQALTSQAYGASGNPYGAHAFIVAGGAGTVDAGQVGLRVVGISGTDSTPYDVQDTVIITDDITSLVLNQYVETPEKWASTIIYEFYTVSGSPTTYSLDFNYGLCKYEDFGNVDFSVIKFEVVGLAGASDADFDITLLHHKQTGWVYHATAFDPGNGVLADWSDTYAPNDNLVNTEPFSLKVTPIYQFVHGDADEGIVVKIVAGANNSVQSMDIHVIGVVESF